MISVFSLLPRLTLDKQSIGHLIILFSLLVAPLVLEGGVVYVLQAGCTIFLAAYAFRNFKKLDLLDAATLVYSGYLLVVTLVVQSLSLGVIFSVTILPLIFIYVRYEIHKSNKILGVLYGLSVFVILANFLSMFMPSIDMDGVEKYFIGGKNALPIVLIPSMFYILYCSYLRYDRLTLPSLMLLIIVISTLFIGGGSTAIVVSLGAIAGLLLVHKLRISPIVYIALFLLLQVLVVGTQYIFELPIVANFVTEFLGKELTLTGRTNVWGIVTTAISDAFFGYGMGNSVVSSQIHDLYEAHNLVLELLLAGGWVLLAIYFYIVYGTFKSGRPEEPGRLYYVASFLMFLYLIIGLSESIPFKIELWIMFAVMSALSFAIKNQRRMYNES